MKHIIIGGVAGRATAAARIRSTDGFAEIIMLQKGEQLFLEQCVGYEGVDKRIDQVDLLIKNSGTIYDLLIIEHAYAPPFSSAKDPVAIASACLN
ncbi:MAG: hypothetical protein LBI45_06455 [Bacteroidales bacterium]|nr:hypothetical protein [Bacteroidales bacterium]